MATSGLLLSGAGLILSGCPAGADLENSEELLNGSSAGIGDGDGDNAAPCDAITEVFQGSCSGTICHEMDGGEAPPGGVDLIAADAGARMLDVDATYPGLSGCPEVPEKLIDSTDLEASLLWTKLNDTQVCGDGMPIPHSAVALPPEQMECVRSWMQNLIDNGAAGGDGDGDGDTGTGGMDAGTGGMDAGTGGMDAGTGGMDATGGMSSAGPIRVEAECALGAGMCGDVMASSTGAPMLEDGDFAVGYLDETVTLTYANIEAAGQDTITLQHAKGNDGGSFEVRLGTADGTLLATFMPTNTGDWTTYTSAELDLSEPLSGTVTLVFVPTNSMAGVLNLDWFELSVGENL